MSVNSTTSKKPISREAKAAVGMLLLMVVIGIAFCFIYYGWFSNHDVAEAGRNRLRAYVNWDLYKDIRKAESDPDRSEQIRKTEEAIVASNHYKNQIGNYHANCPDQFVWSADKTRVRMDLTGCKVGTPVLLTLNFNGRSAQWRSRLYMYGRGVPKTELEKEVGKQLVGVNAQPVIKVKNQNGDGLTLAGEVEPGTFQVPGEDAWLFPQGNADFAEFKRQ